MDITLALQRAVRSFIHGVPALAARMRISHTALNHKVSPTYPGAHCSPDEMVEIMEATGDLGALEAMAARLGRLTIPAPSLPDDGSEAGTALAATVREFGEFLTEVSKGFGDRKISGVELKRIECEGAQALAAIHELMRLAHGVHKAGAKAPALRAAA